MQEDPWLRTLLSLEPMRRLMRFVAVKFVTGLRNEALDDARALVEAKELGNEAAVKADIVEDAHQSVELLHRVDVLRHEVLKVLEVLVKATPLGVPWLSLHAR